MVDDSDITFVVQGAINNEETPKTLKSIRKYYPQAKIILSTWSGSNVTGLDCDEVLLNKDPGALPKVAGKTWLNLNRMIASTKNGLKKVKTKYTFKIRTDFYLEKRLPAIEQYLDDIKNYNPTIFKQPIISDWTSYLSIFVPFHYSDWFMFGLTEDLLKIWDIDLMTDDEALYYENKEKKNKAIGIKSGENDNDCIKLYSEQYIHSNYFIKATEFGKKFMVGGRQSFTWGVIRKSWQHFVNNYIIHNRYEIGINSNKYSKSDYTLNRIKKDKYFLQYLFKKYHYGGIINNIIFYALILRYYIRSVKIWNKEQNYD